MCGIEQRAKKGEDEIFLRDAERTRRAFLCVELGNVQRRVKTRLFYAMRSARGGLFSCGTIEGVLRFSCGKARRFCLWLSRARKVNL